MERGSYLLLQPDMHVLDVHGDDVGTIAEVVADEGLDIFRGIVVARPGWRHGNVFVTAADVTAVDGDRAVITLDRAALDNLETVRAPNSDEERGADVTPSSFAD